MREVALDLDGTLVTCRERQTAVAVAVAGPLDEDRFWADKRSGSTTEAALARQGIADPGAAARAWVERIEDDAFLALDRLAPSSLAAIEAVRGAGLSPVVVTARRDETAVRRQLERLGLLRLVDALVVVDPYRAPELKASVLGERGALGLVGDTESDATAAALAGVPFAAVGGGQRDAAFLAGRGIERVHTDVLAAARFLLEFLGFLPTKEGDGARQAG